MENLAEVQPVSLDMSLEGLRSIPKDTKAVEIDEIDAFSPSPPSPVSSDSKIDQLDEIPRATYIVLNSYDIMQLTVTRSAVDVISDVIKVSSRTPKSFSFLNCMYRTLLRLKTGTVINVKSNEVLDFLKVSNCVGK